MEFLLLFNERRRTPPPDEDGMTKMTAYVDDLRRRGLFRRGGPLGRPAEGAGVRLRDGKAVIIDGPFPETKELIAGFWIVDAADRAAALEIARRCPHVQRGPIEVHAMPHRHTFDDSGQDTAFLLLFRMQPGLTDCDGAKFEQMMRFARDLARDGTLFETVRLADEPPPAHLESRAGTVVTTDGPFAETKDAVGGYSLVRATDRAAAVELATRYPHAGWGPVEVREILFFDPV